jgi:IclR family transcriptional regulator, acetate operon repressor
VQYFNILVFSNRQNYFLHCKKYFHLCPEASGNKARQIMIEIAERRLRGRPRSTTPGQDGGAVQSLERAIAILRTVADADGLSLTEIARIAGLAPSTAYRMLTTLQQHGLAEFEEASQLWFVGVETFRIGSAFLRRRKLAERGRGIIQALMLKTGETANIALAEPDGVVFVTQAETHEPIRAFFRPGTRSPYHASGIGKAVLAFLPEPQLGETLARLHFEVFTAKTRRTASDIAYDLEETRLCPRRRGAQRRHALHRGACVQRIAPAHRRRLDLGTDGPHRRRLHCPRGPGRGGGVAGADDGDWGAGSGALRESGWGKSFAAHETRGTNFVLASACHNSRIWAN